MSVAPEVVRPLYEANKLLAQAGLEPSLHVFMELRASQLNRCAFCIALHMRLGQAEGESLDRLSGVAAWREASWYTARERAALEWTEALTLVANQHPGSELLERMKEHFSDRELAYLTLAINTINSYNRFNVGFGTPPEGAEALFKMLQAQAAPAHA
ncbi:MAG: carboxymuconolactone decarboxylase family protein [Vulcanimicrobiaceae bacterium]